MAITAQERDVLLKRLELARIAKIKKQEEAKAAKAAKTTPAPEPAPAPAPVPVPMPAPEPEPIQSPVRDPMVAPPPVPDLVKAARKAPKKVCLPSDDESDEEVAIAMPKKKKAPAVRKEQPYMKLKIYREPTNPQAFQSLLESIHNPPEYEDDDAVPASAPPPSDPIPIPFQRPPRVVHSNTKPSIRPMVGADRKLEDARAAALAFFS